MASSLLRKKAQEQAKKVDELYGSNAYGGTSSLVTPTTARQSGATYTVNGGGNGLPRTKASDFLTQKASERAQVIDKEYGTDAYGGSTWTALDKEKGINSYLDSVGSLSTRLSDDFASRDGVYQSLDSFTSYRDDTDNEITVLRNRGNIYRDYFAENRDLYGDETVDQILAALDDADSYLGGASTGLQNEYDYWAQFEDEDSYNTYMKGLSYRELMEASDYAEKSQYVSTATGEEPKFNAWTGMYSSTGFGDIDYDIINRNQEAMDRQMVNNVSTNASLLGLDNGERRQMTDDEIGIFNYLYATQGAEAAYEYIDYLTADLNYRQRQVDEEYWASYANEHPVGSSVFSIIESPLKGLSYIGQIADYAEDGEIDQNAGYNKFSYLNSAIRTEVSGIVEENWGGVGSFAYNTGMSMGDFLFNTAITGGNQAFTLAIMSTGAAADGTIAAKDRGLSDGQAFAIGTIAGAAEVITEKFSLDALLDTSTLGKSALTYMLKNSLVEGSEEVGSDVINLVADVLVAKDKSEWNLSIESYMAEGMTEQEAFNAAFWDQMETMGLDFLGGALSGGVMSGGGVGINTYNTYATGKGLNEMNLSAEDVYTFIEEGLASDPSTQSHQLATELKAKLDSGGTLTNYELGQLYRQNIAAIENEESGEALLAQAAQEVVNGGKVTNRMASNILGNVNAVNSLTQNGALTLTKDMSKSQRRAAVKSAVESLARHSDGTTAAGTTADTTTARNVAEMAHDTRNVTELSQGMGKAGVQVLRSMYDPSVSATEYFPAMNAYYQAGLHGEDAASVQGGNILTAQQQEAAYLAGQADAQNGSTGATVAESGRIGLNYDFGTEVETHGGEEVHLRNSGERTGSAYPGRTLSPVVQSTGGAPLRQAQSVPADAGSPSLSYGKAVSTASLGIGGGSTDTKIRLVTGGETAATRKAKETARKRGLRLTLFAGDNLHIKQADGSWASVRAYISGDRVFVRADHPRYDADQLMRHEAGHDMIAKGEVNPDEVRERIEETFGKNKADELSRLYTEAYEGTGLTAEEIWEEVICDSLGDMNVFADTLSEELAHELLTETKKAAAPTEANRTRGPPSATDTNVGGTKFSIEYDASNTPYVVVNTDILAGVPKSRWIATVKGVLAQKFPDGVHVGNEVIKINRQSRREMTFSQYTQWLANNDASAYADKFRAADNADELILASRGYINEGLKHARKDNIRDFARGTVLLRVGKNDYTAEVVVGTTSGGDMLLYDIVNLQRTQIKEKSKRTVPPTNKPSDRSGTPASGANIGQSGAAVKGKFSMESPVEQTQTLVALHNMHEEKLRSTLKLGAWPSPSIAIVQAATGHADYGAYSAVFPRSTIDPEADDRNRVYGSDAWTPTHSNAQIEYEVNFDVLHRFDRMVADLTRDFAGGALYHTSPLGGIVSEETSDDIDKIAEKLSKQESVQAAYLAHLGEEVEPAYREKKFDNLGNELLKQYTDSVGAQELARLVAELETSRKVPDDALEMVRGIIVEDWAERNERRLSQKPELIDKYKKVQHDRIDEYRVERFIRNAWDYYEDGGATAGEIDRYATAEQVTNRLSEISPEGDFGSIERMVRGWVLGEIEGLLGEPGIYNGAEYRDRMGNRKSFDKTHWPVTVENIVRAMNNADARGANMFGYGAAGLAATATPEYGSIEEIHADEGRLHKVPEDEYKQILADLDAELMDVSADIMATTEAHSSNRFEEQEIIGYIISQAAAGKRTAASIKSTFAREGYAITTEQAKNIKTLLDHVAKVPTGYFEAKPRRVVEFSEAVAVLAPSDAPADLISEMEDKGMNVLTYEAGNDQQRLELLNSLEGVKFSRELDSEGQRLTEGQADYFADSKSVDAQGRLKVMYRGGNSDFTVFDRRKSSYSNLYGRGFYFTDSKTHAEQYGNARAFYLNITNPVPTDRRTITRAQMLTFLEAVAENEDDYSFENYGYGATPQSVLRSVFSGKSDFAMLYDVSQTAIGDMVEAVELFNSVNGTGFDGLILDTETVTFRSEQAKSVTNENPTSDPDIRYSRELEAIKADYKDETDHLYLHEKADGTISIDNMVVKKKYRNQGVGTQILSDIISYADATGKTITLTPTSEFGTKARLTKWYKEHGFVENKGRNADYRLSDTMYRLPRSKYSRELENVELLREQNEALREKAEYWKGQTKRTTAENRTVRQADVDKLARQLIKSYGSLLEVKDVSGQLKELGDFMVRGGDGKNELTWREVKDRAVVIAKDIIDSAEQLNDEMYQQYSDLRSYLRKTNIVYGKEYHGDIPDFGDFRKRNFGRLNLKTNGRTNLDSVYEEMSEMWPEFFDSAEQTHPTDQLLHIIDVLDSLRPVYENPFSYDMATAVEYVANDIIDGLLGEDVRQTPPTFADRQAAKLDSQKAKDRQKLDRLRTQKNERIAEIRRQGQERTREALRKVRADRDAKIKDLKARYRAKDAKARESRRATALRAKIQRHVKELSSTLLRPSDKHHVPEALRGPVARLLEAINLESNYEMEFGRDAKYHRVKPGDSLYAEVTKRTQAFAELRKAYAEIAGELVIDPDLLGDNGAPGLFDEVAALADKPTAAMNTSELETIWQTIRAVEASIRSANKMFAAARFQTVSEAAEALRRDNDGKKAKTEYNYIGGLQKLVGVDMLTPEAFLHRLGDSGDAIFRMMRSAQDEHIRIMKAVADFTHEALSDVNVRALEKELHTVTLGGEEVKLSTAQLMELYALMRREQAQAHILAGGILPDVVSTKGLKKITKAEPIRGITLEEVSKAVSLLTAEQTAIAEKLQDYASTTLSDFGNKASMAVYNYKKFTEEHYWPIRSNRQETKSTVEKDTATTSVANRGFTKATKPNANTSVKLGSIFDTFSTHASEMATYAAWLGTTEDVNRIRNFTFRDGEGNRTGTVKGIFDRVHGSQGSAYLQKLLSDIANGVKGTHGETEYMGGLVGNYKAASVGANLRVIIQQPTAILRALDMIAPQYLAAGVRPGGWKKALRYAPIAQWKDWGYFDINTGRQMKDVLFDSDSKLEKVKQASMWMAGKMDSLAWGQLWNAVESETKAKHKELKPGTREFYDAVAARFTEIVDRTQVVDGILQRSQIMRSGSGLTKMATSFMGEPTKQYNMLLTSAYDASHATSKERRTAAQKRLARTVFALSVSGVVNAAAQSIMDAVRDDDKEKDYWDKWLSAFTGFTGEEEGFGEHLAAFWSGNLESIINPAQYIPYAKDVVSILQGYDVSRMDMESIEKTISAAQNMLKALNGEGKYTLAGASANLFAEGARLLGIPVANFKREVKSFAMLAAIESDNYVMQYYMEKTSLNMNYSGNSSTFMDILYNAYVNDAEAYELIYADMVESGYDPEKIKSGMETRMKTDQGVTKAEELDSRYLSPEQQTQYDRTMGTIRGGSIWGDATPEQQDKVEGYLYDLIMGNSDGAKMQEKIDGGAEYGIDETDYLLYKLALSMCDEPSESGKYGSYTNDEVEAAIEMLGLDDEASSYLWLAQGKSEKSNPWG